MQQMEPRLSNPTTTLAPDSVYAIDCCDALDQLPPQSVELVFADPPFNIGYDYDVYDDDRDSLEYLDWSRKWIGSVYHALADHGAFWLAIGDENAAELKLIAQQDCGFHCRSWVVWYYTFGVNCSRGFSRSHTHLFHFVKDPKNFTFHAENPTVRVPSARQLVYGDRRANPTGRLPDNTWILRPQDLPDGLSAEHDTWYYARVAGTFKERQGFHGCQMPEQLLGRIIRTCSNPGDLVVDPFSGSGTTLAAAKKLGRRWLGFDISNDYVEQAIQRIETVHSGDPLDGPEDPASSAPATRLGRQRADDSNEVDRRQLDERVDALLETLPWQFPAAAVTVSDEVRASFLESARQQTAFDPKKADWQRVIESRLASEDWTDFVPDSDQPALSAWESLGTSIAAAEIALQISENEYAVPIQKILLNPKLTRQFDAMAEMFGAKDVTDARWAALQWCSRVPQWSMAGVSIEAPHEIPAATELSSATFESPAVCVIRSQIGLPLFVGPVFPDQFEDFLLQVRDSLGWKQQTANQVQCLKVRGNIWPHVSRLVAELRPILNSSRLLPGSGGARRWADQQLWY